MTDRNNPGFDRRPELDDDDPFAELTRIMGFDPREPVRPVAAARLPALAPAAPAHSETVDAASEPDPEVDPDFSIDLERELMGEFAEQQEALHAAPPSFVDPTAPASVSVVQADEPEDEPNLFAAEAHSIDAGYEPVDAAAQPVTYDDIDLDDIHFDAFETGADEPPQPVSVEPELRGEKEQDIDFDFGDDTFYAAIDASEKADAGRAVEAPLISMPIAEPGFADEPSAAGEGDDVARSVESTFAPEAVVAQEAAETDIAAYPVGQDDTDADFLGEIVRPDMIDGEDARQSVPSLAAMRHAIAQDESSSDQSRSHDETDELDESVSATNSIAVTEQEEQAVETPTGLRGFTPIHQDTSLVDGLEEELNALLGSQMTARLAAPIHSPMPAIAAEPEPAKADTEFAPVQEEATSQDEREDWRPVAVSDRHAEPLPRPTAQFDEPEFSAQADDNAWIDEQPEAEVVGEHGRRIELAETRDVSSDDDFDIDLDDNAFDAAISDAIAQEAASQPQLYTHRETHAPTSASPGREPESMSREGNDPYAALAALSANLKNAPAWPESGMSNSAQPMATQPPRMSAADREMPEIETIDVPEHAIALADDLDLPEFAFEDNAPNRAMNDLDTEFANLLNDMKTHEPESAPVPASRYDDQRSYASVRRVDPATIPATLAPGAAAAAASVASSQPYAAPSFDEYDDQAPAAAYAYRDDNRTDEMAQADLDYDPDFDDEVIPSAYVPRAEPPPQRRGLLIAAIVGGVALLGGAGAFALSSSGAGGNGEVALVKADPAPVKVKPENPGGFAIPNQTNKVYESVAGAAGTDGPQQEKLLSTAEEPVDIPIEDDTDEMAAAAADEGQMPGLAQGEEDVADGEQTTGTTERVAAEESTAKGEDRLDQAMTDEAGVDNSVEVAAVPPRKVRTMIVKADGTLVAREETAAPVQDEVASASEGIVDPNSSAPADAEALPAEAAAMPADAAAMPVEPTAPATASEQPAAAEPNSSGTPARAPIAPSRPSDQPVDIVGQTQPERVAALSPATMSGSWSMQIASQPSEVAAQSSYQDLLRRYGNVLDGRQANIVKAEITGKGTFWRVRVPAGSRSDAIQLCERYKGAGGSCFVSK